MVITALCKGTDLYGSNCFLAFQVGHFEYQEMVMASGIKQLHNVFQRGGNRQLGFNQVRHTTQAAG